MNNSIGLGIIFSLAMGLTACGGDSDSSGNVDADTPVQPTNPDTNQMSACVNDGIGYFKVPAEGCTYTAPYYNNGQTVTFTCDGTTVKNSLGESSSTHIWTMQDHHFFCE